MNTKTFVKKTLQSTFGIENYLFLFQKYLTYTYESSITKTIPYYQNKYRDLRHILDLVPVDGICIDVGANIGFYCTKMAQKVGKNGKVYAFEPLSICFNTLNRVVSESIRDSIVIEKAAVSDIEGEVDIFMPVSSGAVMHGFTRVSESDTEKKRSEGRVEKVKSITLDKYFKNLDYPKISLIKIDVEGYELNVFNGCLEIISRHKPVIVCEIQHSPDNFHVVFDLLESRGYKSFFANGNNLEEIDKNKADWIAKVDYFFIPKK